jgi:hypothetical protein
MAGYDASCCSQACAYCSRSDPASAAKVPVASLVVLGRQTRPAVIPVATHVALQKGQVISSPTVLRAPVPRTSSRSSAGPLVP